jgi:hypothetical protein
MDMEQFFFFDYHSLLYTLFSTICSFSVIQVEVLFNLIVTLLLFVMPRFDTKNDAFFKIELMNFLESWMK